MFRPLFLFAPVILVALAAAACAAPGETSRNDPSGSPAAGAEGFSGSADRPRRHFRVQNPAALTAAEASAVYRDLTESLAALYARSGDPVSSGYQTWRRFNSAPYKSLTHGRRYVSNYANDIARDYGKGAEAGVLPVGSVIAKDSFQVTADGDIGLGPLFVMEKMAQGFNYVTGDWRYSMISAEGELLGRTNGEGAKRVEFCIACHLAREDQDHLFFVPEAFRIAP